MTVIINANPAPIAGDNVVATALNGVVYTENERVHIKTNSRHYVYKRDAAPAGWYARNIKTSDDIFLGVGATPSVELENIDVKNAEAWENIKAPAEAEGDEA